MKDKCYVITFKSNQDTSVLISLIKAYGTWAKITQDTWAIITEKSASEIRDQLAPHVGAGGRFFVIKSGIEAAWRNVECNNEWLKKNL